MILIVISFNVFIGRVNAILSNSDMELLFLGIRFKFSRS